MPTRRPSTNATSRSSFYVLASNCFESRPDIGFTKILLDSAMLPRDPFKPRERRRFKKGFVAAMLFPFIAVVWFIYFSFPQVS